MTPMLRNNRNIVVEYKNKTVIGLTERIVVRGPRGKSKEVMARIDTGATKSSLDVKLAAELKLGPVVKAKTVKSALGSVLRPVIITKIEMGNKEIGSEFTLADRSHMKYRVLIGQNMLTDNNFIIDPSKESKER